MEDADPLDMSLKSTKLKNENGCTPVTSTFYNRMGHVDKDDRSHMKTVRNIHEDGHGHRQYTSERECDERHSECHYEEDDDLFDVLNNIPVKVELEEGDAQDENESFARNIGPDSAPPSSGTHLQEGVASTSGNEANDNNLKVKPKNTQKKKVKRRRLRRHYFSEEEKLARRKIYARERAKKYRNNLSEEQLQTLKAKVREKARQKRAQMSEEEVSLMRMRNREQAQIRRMYKEQTKCEEVKQEVKRVYVNNDEKANLMREKNKERMRMKRSTMTEEEKIIERTKNRERVRRKREMQRAEALLQRIMNVHGDEADRSPNTEHFLQNTVRSEGDEKDQKVHAMHYENELVHNADDVANQHSAQKLF
ncbi:hypothetical protein SK128_003464 [Halocaridina rubra]|uniref:Uncharacterized protein n=1 Tax=Halocaridina rubra TaxID=373956 RepID=A0AAN8WVA1_HALRR